AAEVSGKVDALRPELVSALADGDPRVRQGALISLRAGAGPTGAASAIMAILSKDVWTYVRVAAAETLGESKGGGDVDVALAKATEDEQKTVRGAAVRALVSRRAKSQLPALRARAFDDKEVIEVRQSAVEGLGILCDTSSLDDLFEMAKKGEGNPLQLAAIMALGAIHPPDLAQRLSAINQTSLVVKDAVRRALKAPAQCT
ncbi:MAG: HEAT repeat domain-containing protein, partial [Polyangiales bacterium]